MSASALKLIALVTMVIDHSGAALGGYWAVTGAPPDAQLYYAMRAVGRAAFMLYTFFIAEGCRKSRSFGKYLLRLGLFALISEIPFDFFLENFRYVSSWRQLTFLEFGGQNVFFTLFFGALAIYIWEMRLYKPVALNILPALCPVVLAGALRGDYGAPGAAFIFLLYLLGAVPVAAIGIGKGRLLQILAVMAFGVYRYGGFPHAYWLIAGAWSAALLLGFYNGERGSGASWLKWFFYLVYPAHLAVLAGVFRWVVR